MQEPDKTNGMYLVYKKYKGFKVKHQSYEALVCGFNENKILCATEQRPACSFKKSELDKDSYIDEDYKDKKYYYLYSDEILLDKQTKSGRKKK